MVGFSLVTFSSLDHVAERSPFLPVRYLVVSANRQTHLWLFEAHAAPLESCRITAASCFSRGVTSQGGSLHLAMIPPVSPIKSLLRESFPVFRPPLSGVNLRSRSDLSCHEYLAPHPEAGRQPHPGACAQARRPPRGGKQRPAPPGFRRARPGGTTTEQLQDRAHSSDRGCPGGARLRQPTRRTVSGHRGGDSLNGTECNCCRSGRKFRQVAGILPYTSRVDCLQGVFHI